MGAGLGSLRLPPQQAPTFQYRECAIEAVADRGVHPSLAKPVKHFELCLSGSTGLALELNREAFAVVPKEHVGHASSDPKALQDGCLDRRSCAAIRTMDRHEPGNATPIDMLEKRALDILLGAAVAHGD